MILMVVASEKTTTTTEREGSPQSILRKENTTREGDLQSVPRNDIPIRGEEALRIARWLPRTSKSAISRGCNENIGANDFRLISVPRESEVPDPRKWKVGFLK